MSLEIVKRRQELLKNCAAGVSLVEVVKDLAEKYHVSTRTIYYDWAHRRRWMEGILGVEDTRAFLLELFASHKNLKRLALREFLQGDNTSARVGALNLVRNLNMDFYEMIVTKNLLERVEKLEGGNGCR